MTVNVVGRSRATSLLRNRQETDSGRVGMVELFFDLVFVFAVTQLSHTLLSHPDLKTAIEVGLMMASVWWVWVYTSWVTNWLDPERIPVRICLFALMLAGLVMSASIPHAFAESAPSFAVAYVAIQVGRTLFFLWAVRNERQNMRRNFQRILIWLSTSGLLWIAGAFGDPGNRLVWWSAALAIELISPAAYFWVPGLGSSSVSDWDVDGGHMAERCALFVIIALGESLLATGLRFSEAAPGLTVIGGFVSAFLGSIAMWWLYFNRGAELGHSRIAGSDAPGREARNTYTYLHLPIVAGIIVSAVADNMVLSDARGEDPAAVAIFIGGPVIYLAGVSAFKWVSHAGPLPPPSHLAGLALFAALAIFHFAGGFPLHALPLQSATTAILIIVCVWEQIMVIRNQSRNREFTTGINTRTPTPTRGATHGPEH